MVLYNYVASEVASILLRGIHVQFNESILETKGEVQLGTEYICEHPDLEINLYVWMAFMSQILSAVKQGIGL